MINTFAQIDYLASSGRSPWHHASALGKLLLAGLVVMLAVFTTSWMLLLTLLVTVLTLCLSARLPTRLILAAAAAPFFFSFVFIVATWAGTPYGPFMRMMRPMVASLIAVWLVGTTPYPDLFAPLSRVLPRVVADSLFLTYRAVFALLSRTERLWRALLLRGAVGQGGARRYALMGEAIGTVVLSGFERSQRLYQTMLLRGHSGRICGCRHYLEFTRSDLAVLGVGLWAGAAALLLWRSGVVDI